MVRRTLLLLALLLTPVAALSTVTGTTSTVTFTCTGSTGPFPFTFPADDVGAIVVIDIPFGSLPGVMNVLASTAWTATPVNNSYMNGGSVTLVTACNSGDTLVIARSTEQTQLTQYTPYMPSLYASIQSNVDQLTTGSQDTSRINQLQIGQLTGATGSVTYTPLGQFINLNITGGGGGGGGGTVGSGTIGQAAIYPANGTAVQGGILSVAGGGNGTATPSLIQGANVTITGSWPNQTINASTSSSVSGQVLTYLPLPGSATTLNAPSHFYDNNSTTGSNLSFYAFGLADTLYPYIDTFTASGADESVKVAALMSADLTAGVAGRIYRSTGQGSATAWSQNPFANISVASGALTQKGNWTLKTQPSQTITAAAEVDLGIGGALDCQNSFPGYSPGVSEGGGTFIQPAASGYPTSYLFTDGPLSSSTNTTFSQGDQLAHCGLYANGVGGMTGLFKAWGQEGTIVDLDRFTGFQVGIQVDVKGSGSPQHHFGVTRSEFEVEGDSVDTWQTAVLKGYLSGDPGGLFQNLSMAGGQNNTGIIKEGFVNAGNNTDGSELFCESLMICIHNNAYHGAVKSGNEFRHVSAIPNAPVSFTAYNDNVGPDQGSSFIHVSGVAPYNLVDAEPGGAEIRATINEGDLNGYYRLPFNSILSLTPQAVSTNIPQGTFFYNYTAWPSLFLPGKLATGSQSGGPTVREIAYMTASDCASGVLPYGIAGAGQLASGSSSSKGVGVANKGLESCIFDGATTAGDYVVCSSAAVIGSAVGCHDTGSSTMPTSGIYLGTVQTSTASAPSTPATPTCTLTGATGSTTYTFGVVQRGNANIDQTQSAISSTCSITNGPAWLTTNDFITLSGSAFANCSTTTPCDVHQTAGPTITIDGVTWTTNGFIGQVKSNTSFIDYGLVGDSHSGVNIGPYSAGIIAPLLDVQIGQGVGAALTNPMTTLGDMIDGSSGGTPQRVGIGTAGQVLTVNSGATAPIWQTPVAGTIAFPATVTGCNSAALVYGTSTTNITCTGTLNNNYILTMTSGVPTASNIYANGTVDSVTASWSPGTISSSTQTLGISGRGWTGLFGGNTTNTNTIDMMFGVQTSNYTLTWPVLTANDVPATLGLAQTFSALNTYSAGIIVGTGAISNIPLTVNGFSSSQTANLQNWYQSSGGTLEASISAAGLATFAGGVQSGSTGTYAGIIGLPGYTTLPSLVAGSFNFIGPNSASVTAFGWQMPTATNASAGLAHIGANSSGVSQVTVSPVSLSADVTGQLPIAQGGTNATTAANALINLFPTASEVGDLVYCATYSSGCTSWALLAGNTSGTKYLQETAAGAPSWTTPSGTGTVTSFSAGNLSPLFTTSVATASSTPALSFSLSNAAQNSVLAGPATGGAGAPSYQTAPTISAANMTSFPTFNQNTTGSASSLSISGQTGLMTVTGLTSTNRIKTVRDAADTILELGGSYTPTGTWTSMTLVTPALGTPASGVGTNLTGIPTTRTLTQQFGTPGGSAISTGVLGYIVWPYACTGLSSYSITVDAGTATVKTWKIATGTAIPTTSNSISTSGVSISSGTNVTSSTVTDFTTTTTTAKDIFGIDLSTVSGVGFIEFELVYTGCTQ